MYIVLIYYRKVERSKAMNVHKRTNTVQIKILHHFVEASSGGGNRFLVQLRDYLRLSGSYSNSNPRVVIWNSFPFQKRTRILCELILEKFKNTRIIHRTDGPTMIVRGNPRDIVYDYLTRELNYFFADATVFQSNFSRSLCLLQNWPTRIHDSLIYNQAGSIFEYDQVYKKKKQIVISSWSSNLDIYTMLPKYIKDSWKILIYLQSRFHLIMPIVLLLPKERSIIKL